ncbi:hypothetical protein N9A86_01525 [Akkermansiaceae bacterium]|nr:hypothetical protein [Akkermansiaceae bacterium]
MVDLNQPDVDEDKVGSQDTRGENRPHSVIGHVEGNEGNSRFIDICIG